MMSHAGDVLRLASVPDAVLAASIVGSVLFLVIVVVARGGS